MFSVAAGNVAIRVPAPARIIGLWRRLEEMEVPCVSVLPNSTLIGSQGRGVA